MSGSSLDISKNSPAESQGWEAFRANEPKLKEQHDWVRSQIPSELQTIHNESNLPDKLRRILTWSLVLKSSPRKEPQGRGSSNDLEEESRQSEQELHNGNEPRVPPHIDPVRQFVLPRRLRKDVASEPRGLHPDSHAQTPTTSANPPNESRFINHNAPGSFLGLITTQKTKAEKDQSTASNTKKALPKKDSMVECISCFDEFPKTQTAQLICTHSYCKTCLTTLVTIALQNEASYPPKCCLTVIPLQTALLLLSSKQREVYREKAAEYAVPPQDRWYCPNQKCLKWIHPSKIQGKRNLHQKCPHCATKICGLCRGSAHERFGDCPQDFDLEATITLAELEGWHRCFKCRTMVERITGCRHMTCKCGAQFCYVCGAQWRTCGCTEVDEANRQAELGRRRTERQTALNAEAAEVARAIAAVEEFERRQAEQRRQEEESQQAELARLEAQRIQEEAARRLEEERLEREFREILRTSVEESCQELQTALDEVMQVQRQTLDSRHVSAEQQHSQRCAAEMTKQTTQSEELLATMEANINKRTRSIEDKQRAALDAFNAEQEELEDDLFLEIQLHLRGKADKEAREHRLREKFKKQQDAQREEVLIRHGSERDALKSNATMELEGVKRACDEQSARLQTAHENDLSSMRATVAADRAWFNFLAERRQNLVSANNRLMLEALEAGVDPVGLTEEDAMTIGPFLPTAGHPDSNATVPNPAVTHHPDASASVPTPAVTHPTGETRQEQSQQRLRVPSRESSPSPSRSLVELATTSQALLNSLESDSTVAESSTRTRTANAAAVVQPDPISGSSVHTSMTGSVNVNARVSRPFRSNRVAETVPAPQKPRQLDTHTSLRMARWRPWLGGSKA
ncbi:hypothetical protein A1O3_03056 [Capronia epimyces CBS 606.96]|uniref:RBR-type E3 ubiquitin transferase n=1 Tax=Capronia epimyces CBS 606.96 TaxID=1182542 RepID=W9Z674_9EURO|nr:uncharacterized protein A1O3_03056 [Capronia epimyces CBS 606.96]EXJ89989.1 hypothetical protein A1O3_03056 [Capronia epimyces CBS 606.96]